MKRLLCTLILLCVLAGCASAPGNANAQSEVAVAPLSKTVGPYLVTYELSEGIPFYGQPQPKTELKDSFSPMYPAYNAATFFAAIMTHATISSSMQKAEEKRAAESAQAVLAPYNDLIAQLSPGDMQDYAVSQVDLAESMPLGSTSLVEAARGFKTVVKPVFIMEYAEDALAIRADVSIYASGDVELTEPPVALYQRTVHLHSDPVEKPAVWFEDNGVVFSTTVHDLSRDALAYAIADFQGDFDNTQTGTTTIRYLENGYKTVERGRVIESTCDSLLFESLRNELKRVTPLEECEQMQ